MKYAPTANTNSQSAAILYCNCARKDVNVDEWACIAQRTHSDLDCAGRHFVALRAQDPPDGVSAGLLNCAKLLEAGRSSLRRADAVVAVAVSVAIRRPAVEDAAPATLTCRQCAHTQALSTSLSVRNAPPQPDHDTEIQEMMMSICVGAVTHQSLYGRLSRGIRLSWPARSVLLPSMPIAMHSASGVASVKLPP